MDDKMKLARDEAMRGMQAGEGGPFGALVADADGNVLAVSNNRVFADHDPTQHAEVAAIRKACEKLGTHRLDGCTLYTTCMPCPMCLSAAIWANIEHIYYGCDEHDADAIGFRDERIYQHIRGEQEMLKLAQMDREECLELFNAYAENKSTMY